MQKLRFLLMLAAVLTALSLPASAVAALADKLFSDARNMFKSDVDDASYTLALTPLQKVNNQWRSERERRVSGELKRRTFELPEGTSAEEAYREVQQELQQRSARPLFICSGLDCGSSNSWANNHFSIKQLYGLDQHQYYGVWELNGEEAGPQSRADLFYLTVYIVQRGNKRVYVQIDQLRTSDAEQGVVVTGPATLVEALRSQGYFVLSGVDWSAGRLRVDPEHLQSVAQAMQRDPWLNIRVVGHDYSQGELEQQLERSQAHAKVVTDALLKLGVKPDRVSAHGVGSLAPAGRRGSARIEIVVQ